MNGNTALHHAARNVHVRLVQLLCQRGADVSIRNKQGIQARGVKPWDGKRGWNTTPERWSQETKDAVRDIKNALQEAFNKQRLKVAHIRCPKYVQGCVNIRIDLELFSYYEYT